MRHIWRGVLGAALVYPALWYYSASDVPATPPAATDAASPAGGQEPHGDAPRGSTVLTAETAGADSTRTFSERVPATLPDRFSVTVEPAPPEAPVVPAVPLPRQPRSEDPRLAELPELQETLSAVAQVQQHAADPAELERQLQALDEDPAKLARLKAFADRFIKMPPPRGDNYLPSSTPAPEAPPR